MMLMNQFLTVHYFVIYMANLPTKD
uniref:Uncharacterized protein n=1 Tax=Lepeophtheirus salmonis TaxID=72036 RepID=A0A0K2UR13_LEPSM